MMTPGAQCREDGWMGWFGLPMVDVDECWKSKLG